MSNIKTLKVIDIIGTQYAVAPEDGTKLYHELKKELSDNVDSLTLDFSDITRATSSFFNNSIAIFLRDYTPDELNKIFKFSNLTLTSSIVLKDSIELAKHNFSKNSSLSEVINDELKGQ